MASLYLIHLQDSPFYKIGRSVQPENRLREIGSEGLTLVCAFEHLSHLEKYWHTEFASLRHDGSDPRIPISGRFEWFSLSDADIQRFQRECTRAVASAPISGDDMRLFVCSKYKRQTAQRWFLKCVQEKVPFLCIIEGATHSEITLDLDTTHFRGHTYRLSDDQVESAFRLLRPFCQDGIQGGNLSLTLIRVPNGSAQAVAQSLWRLWLWCKEQSGERIVPDGEFFPVLVTEVTR